jgi:hypothetical protein
MVAGFSTTSRTRPLIISKLDIYFRDKACIIKSKRLLDELFVFVWNGSRPEAQRGYNDDLVISWSIALFVRDTALRLRQQGIELSKKAIDLMANNYQHTAKTTEFGDKATESWRMKVNEHEDEDLSWLLK